MTLSIPAELWGHVFELSLPDDWEDAKYLKALLSVSATCRHWRNVALSTPKLWSLIYLSHRDADTTVDTWIDRSGNCPLNLTLAFRGHVDASIVAKVIAVTDRWRCVKLLHVTRQIATALFSAAKGFPRLHTIEVSQCPITSMLDIPLEQRCQEAMPVLRRLRTDFQIFPGSWIPWEQLTEAHIRFSVHLIRFQESSSLTALSITFSNYEPLLHSQPILRLPHLCSLRLYSSLGTCDPGDVRSIFDGLELPALQNLYYRGYLWNTDSFVDFLQRSSCSLQSLTVSLYEDDDGIVRAQQQDFLAEQIFRNTPNLEEFSFAWTSISFIDHNDVGSAGDPPYLDDSLLKALTLSDTAVENMSVLLPHLRSLDIDFSDHDGVNYRAFAEMIQSRCEISQPGIQPLRNVVIHTNDLLLNLLEVEDKTAIDLLRELRSEGLEVTVLHTD